MLNKTYAIGITTFLRDNCLFNLIKSIQKFLPNIKIYIVDQGNQTTIKKEYYKKLEAFGHEHYFIPYDSGICTARSKLRELCQEKYLVFMEDDFEVIKETDLNNMANILDNDKSLGIVGGACVRNTKQNMLHYEHFLTFVNNKLIYIPLQYLLNLKLIKWQKLNNLDYIYADIIQDFTMWRKEVPDVFDKNIKTVEHTAVYLNVKFHTNWKVAFYPKSLIQHCITQDNNEYIKYRQRKTDIEYIKQKWNITDFIFLSNTPNYQKILKSLG